MMYCTYVTKDQKQRSLNHVRIGYTLTYCGKITMYIHYRIRFSYSQLLGEEVNLEYVWWFVAII